MSESVLQRARAVQSQDDPARPFRDALAALAQASIRHALLRDDVAELAQLHDLDVLVHPDDQRGAFAALQRAGFVLRRDRRLRHKWVFLRYWNGRFHAVDLHAAFVQNGIEYMDARLALGRLDTSGPAPRLGREDFYLHVLLHNILGKSELQAKHLPVLATLRAQGLDAGQIRTQTDRFGLSGHIALDREPAHLAGDAVAFGALRTAARGALLRRPANVWGLWRYRYGDRLRLRLPRRAVVLALLGPDGSGKTSFADALQAHLDDSPLRPGRVYMGCWGHDLLPMRQARRLIPPQMSHARLLARRCGLPVAVSVEEQAHLASRPSPLRLAAAMLRYAVKGAAFFVALSIELGFRYVKAIRASRRPIVISDRWVYDLEFRQGKTPFTHGQMFRRWFFRAFPSPDGVLYLTTPYDLVELRKPQLDRAQFETMDRVFRDVLRPEKPLELVSNAPPDAMVRAFLTQNWQLLLERCNRRV